MYRPRKLRQSHLGLLVCRQDQHCKIEKRDLIPDSPDQDHSGLRKDPSGSCRNRGWCDGPGPCGGSTLCIQRECPIFAYCALGGELLCSGRPPECWGRGLKLLDPCVVNHKPTWPESGGNPWRCVLGGIQSGWAGAGPSPSQRKLLPHLCKTKESWAWSLPARLVCML